MTDNQSSLRLSLEESIYFEKGHEVLSLKTISLEPEIQVEEREESIEITGYLQLTGEYEAAFHEVVEEEEEHDTVRKYLHEDVLDRNDNTIEFFYAFPIDVSLPVNRVDSIKKIDVYVDSFDYDVYKGDYLRIVADVDIIGVIDSSEELEDVYEEPIEEVEFVRTVPFANEVEEVTEEDTEEDTLVTLHTEVEESVLPVLDDTSVDEAFTIEVRKETNVVEEADEEVDIEIPIQLVSPAVPSLHVHEEQEEELFQYNEDPVLFLARNSEREVQSHTDYEEEEIEKETEESHEDGYEYGTDDAAIDAEVEQKVKKKKKIFSHSESISLSDFLARKEDEHQSAKLRMVIVQDGETVDILASKYNISVQQILRMNRLESSNEIGEGQVLYIPSYASTSKNA